MIKKYWKWIVAALALTLIFFLSRIVYFATEWAWFGASGFSGVFVRIMWFSCLVGFSTGIASFLFFFLNLQLVKRLRVRVPHMVSDNVLQLPVINNLEAYIDRAAIMLAFLFSCMIGYGASLQWDIFLKAFYGSPFGIHDPLFSKDPAFYVFVLPFFNWLNNWAFLIVLLTLLVSIILYIAGRNIYLGTREFHVTPRTKVHLLSIFSLLFLLKGGDYYLSMFELVNSNRGIIHGALYTDIFAHLPFLKIALVASLTCALAVFGDLRRKGWLFTLGSIALLLLLSLTGGVIYPGIVQKFIVAPNELNKEYPFIARNIEYTRKAFGLDRVMEREFAAREDLTWREIEKNDATIKNVRLWDHRPLLDTYSELQEIRTYYKFFDVDNDRYMINGEYRQTMLSPRELSYDKLPDKKWINQVFTYTHGYGCTLGPVNKVTVDGLPEFFIKDIPPVSSADIVLKRPEIYFGEGADSYCIVNTGVKEFDYPFGDKNIYCDYKGTGGVPIGSFLMKALWAIRFSEGKILFSSDIRSSSRILYYRNINDAVRRITPYVYYDPDPYMVISEGKLYWIMDGYTLSSLYPYSQVYPGLGNYIRNSVKAVIDAYNGTMKFYLTDGSDPIISTYSTLFPGVFEPIDRMPDGIRAHLRYPAGLFYAQALTFATYHMTDPQVFYNKEDLWKIPRRLEGKSEVDMKPYYTILKFPAPEGEKEEFILMIPFNPARKENMIAWMAARCDAPNYGKIVAYSFPKDKQIFGPLQIEARIDQDPEISKLLSLWGQGGSEVIRGSLLVIPIEDSLLYIEPLYLAADKGRLPQLKRVIVVYGRSVAMEPTLEEALKKVFTGAPAAPMKPGDDRPPLAHPLSTGTDEQKVKELITRANTYFEEAKECQRNDNWAGYGEKMSHLREALMELQKLTGKDPKLSPAPAPSPKKPVE